MAQVFHWQPLSENVVIFRLRKGAGETFPEYKAGQNLELYRGESVMVFSIASAPADTKKQGYLEFFVSRDNALKEGDPVEFSNRASGNFTLERTAGFSNVIFVATGTGVAPFISMIRELSHTVAKGTKYTLIHGSRNRNELGYHNELSALAAAGKPDLMYIPTISRPSAADWKNTSIGKGRAGNVFRKILHLPLKGEASLPETFQEEDWNQRFQPDSTIILACGSHASVSDIKHAASEKGIRFEREDW